MDSQQVEKVKALFDEWAQSGRSDQMEEGHVPTALQAFARLELSPGQRYLDIGCGNGYTVRWAAQIDSTVHGVGLDVSEEMIRTARERSKDFSNTLFLHAEFPVPELRANTFDAIFSMEALYYFRDLPWALLNIFRLLKSGGLFVCTVDYYEENEASHDWPEKVGVEMNLLSQEAWRHSLTVSGFQILEETRLSPPLKLGEEPTWQHTVGSLMFLCRRPAEGDAP